MCDRSGVLLAPTTEMKEPAFCLFHKEVSVLCSGLLSRINCLLESWSQHMHMLSHEPQKSLCSGQLCNNCTPAHYSASTRLPLAIFEHRNIKVCI